MMNIRMGINEKKIENKKRKSIKPKVYYLKRSIKLINLMQDWLKKRKDSNY